MSGTIAEAINVNERQRKLLEGILRQSTSEQGLVERVQIILACREARSNSEIGREIGVNRNCVAKWRERWRRNATVLEEMEARGVPERILEEKLKELLADAKRSGTPPRFSAYQVVQIVAVASEAPAESDRPVSAWTPKEIAAEVVKRGIVEQISPASVARFLKGKRTSTAS